MPTSWRHKFCLTWSMTSKIQGHITPLLCQNLHRIFVCGPMLIKICMNANIIKTQFFIKLNMIWNVSFCYGEVLWFFVTLRPSNLITTLTYVLMDNLCPCYSYGNWVNLLNLCRFVLIMIVVIIVSWLRFNLEFI